MASDLRLSPPDRPASCFESLLLLSARRFLIGTKVMANRRASNSNYEAADKSGLNGAVINLQESANDQASRKELNGVSS